MTWEVLTGDCVLVMRAMPADSIDAIVCDPPYGLEFMGKQWDRLAPVDRARMNGDRRDHGTARVGGYERAGVRYSIDGRAAQDWHEAWAREAIRVLKPGGHVLAFGGTRTYHRLTCALEDAGFEIRDALSWLYASGFPKSLDVSKAIDKAAGAEREVVGQRTDGRYAHGFSEQAKKALGGVVAAESETGFSGVMGAITAPATPDAERWQGWGTALKPAYEPIVVARKPLVGTVTGNVLEHGTGALNVDGCRIGMSDMDRAVVDVRSGSGRDETADIYAPGLGRDENERFTSHAAGRWPANVVFTHDADCVPVAEQKIKAITGTAAGRMGPDYQSGVYGGYAGNDQEYGKPTGYGDADGMETVTVWACVPGCPVRALDDQTGTLASGDNNFIRDSSADHAGNRSTAFGAENRRAGTQMVAYGDAGGASRFFYCAKASRAERHRMDLATLPRARNPRKRRHQDRAGTWTERVLNRHPTVKPIDLMRWLVRLVTPPGGRVLDPFTGSGSTGIAAILEGFDFTGIERDRASVIIANARIAWWHKQPPGATKHLLRPKAPAAAPVADGQLDLFAG